MFQSDPILWLQQFQAPWLFASMRFLSWIGEAWFYTPAVLVVVFGMRLRPGMGVLLALILATFATDCVKQGFGLPRPSEVDARVLDKGRPGRHVVADGAANAFWALPDPAAIQAVRATGRNEYGFASGHTSAATAFALGLALFFGVRRRWPWAVAIAWALLMGVSRMYLGRHFLGDVLGGLAVGAASLGAAWALMRALRAPWPRARRPWAAAVGIICSLGLAAWWTPWIHPGRAGEVAGALLCIGALGRFGWPDDHANTLRRLARVACALALGLGIIWLVEAAYAAIGWPDRHPAAFFFSAIGFGAVLLGTVAISRRLGLYGPPPMAMASCPASPRA